MFAEGAEECGGAFRCLRGTGRGGKRATKAGALEATGGKDHDQLLRIVGWLSGAIGVRGWPEEGEGKGSLSQPTFPSSRTPCPAGKGLVVLLMSSAAPTAWQPEERKSLPLVFFSAGEHGAS